MRCLPPGVHAYLSGSPCFRYPGAYNFPMTEQETRQTARQSALDDEMVALAVAASVTYFHLTDVSKQVNHDAGLVEMFGMVAVALSQVAPIYRSARDGSPAARLSPQEVDSMLFKPLGEGGETPSLDDFCIRRGDLRHALVTLREAKHLFGRPLVR